MDKTQIVILGGGFAGMTTAECLEREFGADRSVSFTLVSEGNALLFTPMLAEVAGSSVEPSHISSPSAPVFTARMSSAHGLPESILNATGC